jgi:3-hydroxyisobutyrate dehydrogenase-like beta-hydroxyacid dehydrogenase
MRVAFVGLGTMGRPMAEHVLRAGHELTVHDVRRAAAEGLIGGGARWAGSPAEAARGAELILTSLPGPKEVEQVVLGATGVFAGAERGAIYADLSTSSPTLIRRIHSAGRERGVEVLDAPVSGGPYGARDGTLAVMVGGDERAFERIRPVLAAIGDKVSHIGDVGAGAVAKLVHNMVSACTFQAVAEGLTLGVKAGVRPEKLLEALKGGSFGQGYTLNYRVPEIVFKDDFDTTRFALALLRKDVGLATELGRELGVPMSMAALIEQELISAVGRGWGARDASAAFLLQEERAGVEVRATPVEA